MNKYLQNIFIYIFVVHSFLGSVMASYRQKSDDRRQRFYDSNSSDGDTEYSESEDRHRKSCIKHSK